MVKFLVGLLCSMSSISLYAQKENNVWVFGRGLGINFSNDRFIPFKVTDFQHYGAAASISDRHTGELLFFTQGRSVWDRNFRIMPNGTDLRGGATATQAVLIIPFPERAHKYYVFTIKAVNDTIPLPGVEDSEYTGLYYSVVDMRLNRGFGDVVEEKKNSLLLDQSSEQLTAIPHKNGKDYWLITHEWKTNRFIVYPVTAEGIGEAQYFPLGHSLETIPAGGYLHPVGWMLPSPDGTMLAMAVSNWFDRVERPLELYDFDATTGALSNRRELGRYEVLKGVSFSPDNTKLYFSNHLHRIESSRNGSTYQLDLSRGSLEEILESRTELMFIHETGLGGRDTLGGGLAFQLAPDGRLYAGQISIYRDNQGRQRNLIACINKPNEPGLACEPTYRAFNVENIGFGHSPPNLIQHPFNGLTPIDNEGEGGECETFPVVLYPNPASNQVTIYSVADCFFPVHLQIYNSLGQLIRQTFLNLPPYPVLDIYDFASGTYYFMFTYHNRVFAKKLIKL